MSLDLDPIKKRCEAAMDGPWEWFDLTHCVLGSQTPGYNRQVAYIDGNPLQNARADGEFIAAARQDIPALIAEVERLEAIISKYLSKHMDDEIAEYRKRMGEDICKQYGLKP